jgi:hypothetical protein
MQWLFKVSRDSAATYVLAVKYDPSNTKAWVFGLVAAVVSGIFHSAPTDPMKVASLKATYKIGLLLLAFSFLVTPAHADWKVKSKSLKPVTSVQPGKLGAIPAGLNENALVLIPTAALGLGVGDVKNSYGFSAAYGLLWCHVKGDTGTSTSSLTPYLGVGAAVFLDAGPFLNSDLKEKVQAKVGGSVIGPELCGIVPGVLYVWDPTTKAKSVVISANVPFGLFSNAALIKLLHL